MQNVPTSSQAYINHIYLKTIRSHLIRLRLYYFPLHVLLLTQKREIIAWMENSEKQDRNENHATVENEESGLILHQCTTPAHLHLGNTIKVVRLRFSGHGGIHTGRCSG